MIIKKRNLNQNEKYWKLLNELALVLKIGTEELHREMLKNYSVRYQVMLPHGTELRGVEYYTKKSTIKAKEGLFDVYEVYVPSHELKESEFAVLLQGLIECCEEQQIDIRSPEEILRDEQFNL